MAAIELKSHVGPSFGNNFNNRIEEALGNAIDIEHAYQEGDLGPVRPWLGFVLLLEEAPGSTRKGTPRSSTLPVNSAFAGTSYKDRYAIFCRRLVQRKLYDAACFVTSSQDDERVHEPDPEVGFAKFVAAIAGRAAYIKGLSDQ